MSSFEFAYVNDEGIIPMTDRAIDALVTMIRQLPKGGDTAATVVAYASGDSGCVMVVDPPPPASSEEYAVALKIFKGEDAEAASDAAFEATIGAKLAGNNAPLAIPRLVSYTSTYPDHLISSKAPGHYLTHGSARNFSPAEKQIFGTKIGQFVAWLGEAIGFDDYSEMVDQSGRTVTPDRVNNMQRYAHKAHLGQVTDSTLASVLIENWEEYLDRQDTIKTPIIGHDDLRTDNMTFAQEDGLWVPKAIFDFGLLKPSSPERELRHLLPLGPHAIEPAIDIYQEATGQTISRPLLRMWAIGQAATACAYFAAQEQILTIRLEERLKDLMFLLPDRDWSSLNNLLESSR